ncbi:MAG: hypothetical protein WDN46_24815 [Methylocella sp.]
MRAWALWRDQELVNFAAAGRSWEAIRDRARKSSLNQKTEELWTASGLDPKRYVQLTTEFPRSPDRVALDFKMGTLPFLNLDRARARYALKEHGSENGRSALNQIVASDLRRLVDAVLSSAEVHGPFQQKTVSLFPINQYILRLLRSGDLTATGWLPDEPLARKVLPADWAGLEIARSHDTNRFGVWRLGVQSRSGNGRRPWLTAQHPGGGDLENVQVQREGILKVFRPIELTTRESDQDRLRSAPRSKGGRPPGFDWNMIRSETFRLMEYNDEFSPDDPKWNAQARLETALQEFCSKTFHREPSASSLRKRISGWLSEWRNQKTRGQKLSS